MCGIVGMFGVERPSTLEGMLSAIAHRGVDDTNYRFFDGHCGLGINRLSIMDIERGGQPLANEAGDVQVVCNGEIYNTRAIAAHLAGHTLRTRSDVEVIPHLYEDHGDRCVELLDGMFAFVLYDARRRTFLAARDPLGIKPLYYARDGRRWYLSSEAKALLETGLDPAWIHLLPPGFKLTPERGPEQYYHLPRHVSVPNPDLVRTLVEHAVGKRLLADVEVGTFLSGGLDSSIVTAVAASKVPKLRAVTVGVEGSPDVEAARTVAAHLGVQHHVRTFTLDDLVQLLPQVIWHVESYNPSMVTGAIVTLMAARAARDLGLKVVLCGEGADEIFAGYLALRDLPRDELTKAAWTLLRNLHKTELQRLDRMSMAVSVEARVPFMDRDLVEYALNLPPNEKLRDSGGRRVEKWILREAFADLLPPSILWREKEPFDQGSGARSLIAYATEHVSERELYQAQQRWPEAGLVSREMLFYYRIWRDMFGDMGGRQRFDMFADYPVMMAGITERTAASGS